MNRRGFLAGLLGGAAVAAGAAMLPKPAPTFPFPGPCGEWGPRKYAIGPNGWLEFTDKAPPVNLDDLYAYGSVGPQSDLLMLDTTVWDWHDKPYKPWRWSGETCARFADLCDAIAPRQLELF